VQSPRSGISAHPRKDRAHEFRFIDYSAGDRLLLTTDGLTDQVGGEGRLRSFGYSRTKAILESSLNREVTEVADELIRAMDSWRGVNERRDDVTVICIDL